MMAYVDFIYEPTDVEAMNENFKGCMEVEMVEVNDRGRQSGSRLSENPLKFTNGDQVAKQVMVIYQIVSATSSRFQRDVIKGCSSRTQYDGWGE